MPYSDIDDLLKEFKADELAMLTGDPAGQQINVVRVDYARELAEAVINSYLYGRWFAEGEVPPDMLLRKLSVDLTVYNLFEFCYARTEVPTTIIWRRANAFELLKKLQAGDIALISLYGATENPPAIRTNKKYKKRTFDEDLLNKYSGE